ncbi:hypothetical protein L226DRAFT_170772 [Lentinus tigrinus ALCF2SS1-7]|uniref:uncharacterized protein n=1 Tax=Lentinus tigrinus ALCF2SS1-7 TaxID=1328758 RepID=UPI0011661522|nr:hypothetical protein L226DRAFT_170772 [Lentinus tigrinus ALCF2SS1-7]
MRRLSSPDIPHPASPPSRSSTENSPRPISERTVRLSELGLAVSCDARDEAPRRHPTTSEEIQSPESLHAGSPVHSQSTTS